MTKFSLNEAGVAQKVAELNTLTRSKLVEQAGLIRADFRSWLRANFTLTTEADNNIGGWDAAGNTELGTITAEALMSNTNIVYLPGTAVANAIGKWTEAQKKKTVRMNGSGVLMVTETLVFTTEYY